MRLRDRQLLPHTTFGTSTPLCYKKFRDLPELPDYSNVVASQAALHSEEVELLPGLRNLRHGEEAAGPNGLCYMGGLENPGAAASPETPGEGSTSHTHISGEPTVDCRIFADFSDEEWDADDADVGHGTAVYGDFTDSEQEEVEIATQYL